MKEFLKSFGYTVAGITTIVAVVAIIVWCLDALESINPNLQHGAVVFIVVMMITFVVHMIRTKGDSLV